MGHTEKGREVLDDFLELMDDNAVVEKAAKMEGRNMTMFLVPKSE